MPYAHAQYVQRREQQARLRQAWRFVALRRIERRMARWFRIERQQPPAGQEVRA